MRNLFTRVIVLTNQWARHRLVLFFVGALIAIPLLKEEARMPVPEAAPEIEDSESGSEPDAAEAPLVEGPVEYAHRETASRPEASDAPSEEPPYNASLVPMPPPSFPRPVFR